MGWAAGHPPSAGTAEDRERASRGRREADRVAGGERRAEGYIGVLLSRLLQGSWGG